jgi:integrase
MTPTWSNWLETCIERMKLTNRPSTVVNYDKQLRKWTMRTWGDLELSQIQGADIHRLVYEDVSAALSPNTRRTILKMIRRIFQMALDEGLVTRNPASGIQVKVPEVDAKVLTNEEAKIFLREARQANHRFYPVWFVALATGMRSGELMAMTWNDIDLENRTISVSRQWTSKTGYAPTKTQRSRIVPIADDLAQFLRELKLKRGSEEFVLPHLKEWENGEQAQVTREFCAAVEVTPVKFHDLRATFITNLLSRGVSLAQVMAVVGHNQLKTTNSYLRKAGVEVRGVTEKLGYKLPDASKPAQVFQLVTGP